MKILFLTLASLALGNSLLSAQVGETFISPGVRCGYTFGDRGGFTLGVELSVTRRVGVDTYAGMLVDVYAVGAMKMVHVGAEATYHFVGLSLGPTFAETPEGTRVGYSLIAYGLFIVMPYYALSGFPGSFMLDEFGAYLKLPIHMSGPRESFKFG